ncbi:MAG: HipA domain-containing protein, partial [Pseudonocardiaceae bacterium]
FTVLISNGDAHLKNWSLIYPDHRIPRLAPAYDLVSTAFYLGGGEQLGLKFGGTRRFDRISVSTFERLERRLGTPTANLAEYMKELVEQVNEHWPEHQDKLAANPALLESVHDSIVARSRSLLRVLRKP